MDYEPKNNEEITWAGLFSHGKSYSARNGKPKTKLHLFQPHATKSNTVGNISLMPEMVEKEGKKWKHSGKASEKLPTRN